MNLAPPLKVIIVEDQIAPGRIWKTFSNNNQALL
jgi:hypothetical protein